MKILGKMREKVPELPREEMLETLLQAYGAYFDIERMDPGQEPLVAVCHFHVRSAKYVLMKKAELWSAKSNEHVYIFSVPQLTADCYRKCEQTAFELGMALINPDSELWLEPGQTYKDVSGFKAILTNPYVATIITVVLGVALGMTGYSRIWPLFGAANQLLAALGLLAVAAWLGNVGKNNRMFLFPLAFMLVVTIVSLIQTIITNVTNAVDMWCWIRAAIAILLVVLSGVLAVEGVNTIKKQAAK